MVGGWHIRNASFYHILFNTNYKLQREWPEIELYTIHINLYTHSLSLYTVAFNIPKKNSQTAGTESLCDDKGMTSTIEMNLSEPSILASLMVHFLWK